MSSAVRKTTPLIAAFAILLVWLPHAVVQSQAERQADKPQPAPQIVLQTGHSGAIKAIAFSPDGQTVLSAGDDRTVIVWDVQTGEIKRKLEGHPGAVSNLISSRDGRMLATVSEIGVSCGTGDGYIEAITFWDTRIWQIKGASFHGYFPGVSSALTFSQDSQRALIHKDYETDIWEMQSGKKRSLQKVIPAPAEFLKNGEVICFAFSDSGAATVQWLDEKTFDLKRTQKLEGFVESVDAKTFSPNGGMLAVTLKRNRSIQLWDTQTGQYKQTLAGSESAYDLEFLRDGKTIKAFTEDGKLKLWDVATGKLIRSVGVNMAVNALSPDFKIAAVVADSGTSITLQEVASGKLIRKLTGQGAPVKINVEDGAKSLLDVWGDALDKDSVINSVRYSPDGKLIAHGSGGAVRLWNTETLELAGSLTGHKDEVTALDFAPDGKTIASSSQGGSVKLWDVSTGKLKRTLTDVKNPQRLIAFDAKGAFVSKGNEDEQAFAVSADRKLVFSDAGKFHIRDLSSGKIVKTLTPTQNGISQEPFPDWATAGAFSADGKRLAVGDACGSVFVFSTATGKVLRSFSLYESEEKAVEGVNAVAFSPYGKTIAAGTDSGAIKMLDAETGKLKFAKLRHANQVASVTFSPDGRILATGGYDRIVKLWDAASGRLLVTLMILPAGKAGQAATEWIAITPESYYSGSPGAERFIRWRVGNQLFPAEKYKSQFRKLDLAQKVLK